MAPQVQEVLAWLKDYMRAALGPVQMMEAPLLDYLRIAEAEHSVWEGRQMSSGKKA